MLDEIKSTATYLKKKINQTPDIVLILGSGLGELATILKDPVEVLYSDIPHFPQTTVTGHTGKLTFGELYGKKILIFQGRFHFYEGYSMNEVIFPIRVAGYLGAKNLIVTNAAGGLNPQFEVGEIMLITDHINQMGDNPLIGKNIDELGPRFPDMTKTYSREMNNLLVDVANNTFVSLQSGVYVAVSGPTYETPAEFKYLRIIGGDAVGMSTVPEVIAAKHMGMNVMGISVITDMGTDEDIEPISHEDVQRVAQNTGKTLTKLLENWIKQVDLASLPANENH